MLLTADHVINCRSCYTGADHVTDHTNTDYLSSKEHANNTVHIKNQLFSVSISDLFVDISVNGLYKHKIQ